MGGLFGFFSKVGSSWIMGDAGRQGWCGEAGLCQCIRWRFTTESWEGAGAATWATWNTDLWGWDVLMVLQRTSEGVGKSQSLGFGEAWLLSRCPLTRGGQPVVQGEEVSPGASVRPALPGPCTWSCTALCRAHQMQFAALWGEGGGGGLRHRQTEQWEFRKEGLSGWPPPSDLRRDPGPLYAVVRAFTLLEQGTVAWFWPRPNSLYANRTQRQFGSYHRPGTIPGRQFVRSVWARAASCHLVLRPVLLNNADVAPVAGPVLTKVGRTRAGSRH